jgi:hypothetical protein
LSEQSPHPSPPAELPPLRIHHFLVWMAVLSALIAFRKRLVGDYLYGEFTDISFLADTIYQSLSVTVLAFVVAWRMGKKPLFTEPGHGLLLQEFVIFASGIVGAVMVGFLVERNSSGQFVRYLNDSTVVRWCFEWQGCIWTALQSLVVLGCGIWIARALRWRMYFFVTAAALAIHAIIFVVWSAFLPARYWSLWGDWSLFIYTHAPSTLAVAIVLWAVALDWRDHINHHWPHWCGVIGLLITSFISIAMGLSEFLSSPSLYSVPQQIPTTTF